MKIKESEYNDYVNLDNMHFGYNDEYGFMEFKFYKNIIVKHGNGYTIVFGQLPSKEWAFAITDVSKGEGSLISSQVNFVKKDTLNDLNDCLKSLGFAEKFDELTESKQNKRINKIEESIDKDTLFAVDGSVEVYEDSYEHGEGDYVHSYELDIKGKYSFKDLMKQLSYYGYSTDPKDYTFDDVNGYSTIYSSCMQNADGYEPSKSEIERWKKGEITLYTANLSARIYEVGVHDVSYEDAKEIGFSF